MIKHTFTILIIFLLNINLFGQTTDSIKSEGITSPLHQANIGKITFMGNAIPMDEYREIDFLKTIELTDSTDFNIRTYLGNSLTGYLHMLAPGLSVKELNQKGNYQFSFYIDDSLIYKENLNPRAGTDESKITRTVFRVPLISTSKEDSWGRFLWNRFMMNGGQEALSGGSHFLKIEIRPYINANELKVGEVIASGQIQLIRPQKNINEKQIAVQSINPGSGWKISTDEFDVQKIRSLNQKIAEDAFKNITSIVVIKNGKLLIEEYFNGANRNTLHDTRSVGKSFTSALMGLAIDDGYVESVNQTLKDFYDLTKFKNYSSKKDSVTLKSLLTMSSGFDGSDDNPDSPGNEEKMYPTSNWVKFTLDLPMDNTKIIGKNWDYLTAGVIVLGHILQKNVPGGLEKYANRKLFEPLGITQYEWQYTPQNVVNTAGSVQMNSLDYAKFGLLYENKGMWNGKEILTKSWVKSTFTKYLTLPDNQFNYGYLFWNKTFNINGKDCETFFSTGNGGSKIYVFTNQPLVVIITATAFNKPFQHIQVDRIMQNYILPAVIR
jgi:CubicO group peptidase (beta-lactamase class C family)